jgi:hypothetical protein
MEQLRYLRYKEKRHTERKERVQEEVVRKHVFDTLEDDFNHNFVDPLKDWTGFMLMLYQQLVF